MVVFHLLRREIQSLHALEEGVFFTLRGLTDAGRHQTVRDEVYLMMADAERHLAELERICAKAGWPTDGGESLLARAWREEIEAETLPIVHSAETDAALLCALRRAAYLKLPGYECGAVFARQVALPGLETFLRGAALDEQDRVFEIASLVEIGARRDVEFTAF